jgi:hypothetical protein
MLVLALSNYFPPESICFSHPLTQHGLGGVKYRAANGQAYRPRKVEDHLDSREGVAVLPYPMGVAAILLHPVGVEFDRTEESHHLLCLNYYCLFENTSQGPRGLLR